MEFSNFSYRNIIQFRNPTSFASSTAFWMGIGSALQSVSSTFRVGVHGVPISGSQSPFSLCVERVIPNGSVKQMIGAATRWIITRMTGEMVRPSAIQKVKNESGGAKLSSSDDHDAVSQSTSGMLPFPAITIWPLIRLAANSGPEHQNIEVRKIGWCKIGFSHFLKISFRDVVGLRGVKSVPQAAIIT